MNALDGGENGSGGRGGSAQAGRGATGGGHFVVEVCISQENDRWKEVSAGRGAAFTSFGEPTFHDYRQSFSSSLVERRGLFLTLPPPLHSPSHTATRRWYNDVTPNSANEHRSMDGNKGLEGHRGHGASEDAGGGSELSVSSAAGQHRGPRRARERVGGKLKS